jgi:hypothetical protein
VRRGGRNILSGNRASGIYLNGAGAAANVIQANYIGANSLGTACLSNLADGITLQSAADNLIGGTNIGEGNVISANGKAGISLSSATNNTITENFVGTDAMSIDLGVAGPTLNDHCDVDTGANLQQNFPALTQAVSGSATGVRGTLDSAAGTTFLLQFFANPTCDSSGYGEGQIYLGDAWVTTSASCTASFLIKLPLSVPSGYVVTSTATDPAGNTSEFSACVAVTGVPRLNLGLTNRQATLSWTNDPSGFVLKQTSSLAPPVTWTTVTNVPSSAAGMLWVTLPVGSTNKFFLLSFE